MSLLEVGRVCRIVAGRDAGSVCAVIEAGKDGIKVDGPNINPSKISASHLEPYPLVLDLKKTDSASVAAAITAANVPLSL